MRFDDWPTILAQFVASRAEIPFQWGVHDCTLFAADCALAITGADPAAAIRGQYNSALSAARLIAAGGGMRAMVTAALGAEINPRMAQRGDVVMVVQDGTEALAVCMGVNAVAAGSGGPVQRPMLDAIAAWRIN